MPRLGGPQSQSYVIGSSSGSGDKSDLPRFERPVLKPARSSYSSERLQAMAKAATSATGSNGISNGGSSLTSSGRRLLRSISRSKSRSGDSSELPTTVVPQAPNSSDGTKSRFSVRTAIGGGRDQALPDWSRPPPETSQSFNRPRTSSGTSLPPQEVNVHSFQQMQQHSDNNQRLIGSGSVDSLYMEQQSYQSPYQQQQQQMHNQTQMELEQQQQQAQTPTQPQSSRALRQRKPMEDVSYAGMAHSGNSIGRNSSMRARQESPYRSHKPSRFFLRNKIFRYPRCNMVNVFQGIVVLFVTAMLFDSHYKATTIAARLRDFKSEESMVFLHLHRIEEQSIQLHHALERLNEAQAAEGGGGAGGLLAGAKKSNNNNNKNKAPAVDSALIQKQTQQLMQMEEELSHEVRTLQTRIQHSAVKSIVQEYGEGPVQVVWEVEVDGQVRKISILLWHDTPHAAWSWLEQISRRLWDGASIKLENSRIMGVTAPHPDTETHLDFIETSQQRHDPWTVGLTEAPGGGLEVFINLQDNASFSKHNVCVGKVFDGFDVLHKMVEHSRKVQLSGGDNLLTIRTARASHLTNPKSVM